MAGSRRRGLSLEERLLAIRAAAPPEETAPAAIPEATALAAAPEPVAEETPLEPLSPQFAEIVARLSASEGDTFLPADSVAAVEAEVRDLRPQPTPAAEPSHDAIAPHTTPLSKLFTDSWIGSRRTAAAEPEPPTAEPEAATFEPESATVEPEVTSYWPVTAIEPEPAVEAETVRELEATFEPEAVEAPEAIFETEAEDELEAIVEEEEEEEEPPEAEPILEPEAIEPEAIEPEAIEPEATVEETVEEPNEVANEVRQTEWIVAGLIDTADREPVDEAEPEAEPEPIDEPEAIFEAEPVADLEEFAGLEAIFFEPQPAGELEEIPEPEEAPEPEAVDEPEPIAAPREFLTDDSPWTRRIRTERFGRIGTTLIERGLITNDQLDEALDIQRTSGRRVGDILVDLGALSSFELARVLADHMGVPFTDLRTKPPDPLLATLLPEDVARRYDALAIARWNEQLVIAMVNPTDLFALDDLQMVTRQPIIAAMAVKEDLHDAIDRVYRTSIVETTLDAATSDYTSASDLAQQAILSAEEVDEGPIVGLVNALMGQAVTDHASDLHIEPSSTHIAIRFRVDGVLHDSSTVPLNLLRPLVSRVKILAGLDIAQNRLAQDGRFSLNIEGRSVDVRVVTMPTAAGESVILRLLDPVRDALGVSSLGLSAEEKARFVPAFFASQGAVFIAGPTGSGKTSTIYAVLSEVNTRSKSIVSIEDPVEFRLDGIKQIQINPRVGLTFPTTLPSVLRADPDVVFIGEVRDTDTARIAADASITGHLVLSTVHATRAASAPMRLIEMGVEPYLVASALTLVASQRLARKLCEHCARPAESSSLTQLRELGADDAMLEGALVRHAVGCPACRGTGYRGRLPIFEIMPVTEGISRLILDRASRAEIEGLAVEEGMDTMHTAALRRVVRGNLSIDEMMRVVS